MLYSLQLDINIKPPTNPIFQGINNTPGANISNTTPTITVPKSKPNQAISRKIPPITIAKPIKTLKIHIYYPLYLIQELDYLFACEAIA